MSSLVLSILGDPEPSTSPDPKQVTEHVRVFLHTFRNECFRLGIERVTILTGPSDHPLSRVVRELAPVNWRVLDYPKWGDPTISFNFYDKLALIGPAESPWCQQAYEDAQQRGKMVYQLG